MDDARAGRITSVSELDFRPRGEVFASPRDWRDAFIYQLMIDRFDDDRDHQAYEPTARAEGARERDVRAGGIFQGGKIRGVTRRLDYIRKLGCGAIWLSPVYKNRQERDDSYHGYAVQDFLEVDPRFGTVDELRELVNEAHARGMYVILDVVINHTGDNWGYPEDQRPSFNEKGRYEFGFWRKGSGSLRFGADDAVWPVELQDPEAYVRRGRIGDLANAAIEERRAGDFYGFKKLELRNQRVLDAMIRIHKYWIAATDVDGFRLDAVAHLESGAAAVFCHALREYARRIGKENFLIFGEVVGDDEMLDQYIVRGMPVEGAEVEYPLLDAVLDFPLYGVLEEVIKGLEGHGALRERYERLRRKHRDFAHASRSYVTFVDNHDQIARPYRRFMHECDDPKLAILAMGYLLTQMGVPCIYYGTEQGFDGGGDADACVRECMFGGTWGAFGSSGRHFFNENREIYRAIAEIAKVRAAEPALRYGRQYFRETSADGKRFEMGEGKGGVLAFSRILDTDEIVVAMNLDAEDHEVWVALDGRVTPPGSAMVDLLGGGEARPVTQHAGGVSVRVPLKSRAMVMLKAKAVG